MKTFAEILWTAQKNFGPPVKADEERKGVLYASRIQYLDGGAGGGLPDVSDDPPGGSARDDRYKDVRHLFKGHDLAGNEIVTPSPLAVAYLEFGRFVADELRAGRSIEKDAKEGFKATEGWNIPDSRPAVRGNNYVIDRNVRVALENIYRKRLDELRAQGLSDKKIDAQMNLPEMVPTKKEIREDIENGDHSWGPVEMSLSFDPFSGITSKSWVDGSLDDREEEDPPFDIDRALTRAFKRLGIADDLRKAPKGRHN